MAPNTNNINHAPVAMVIDAKKAPNINDPTSPINNLAGCQLNNKNIPSDPIIRYVKCNLDT